MAPHTSNYDFILGKLYYWAIGRKAGFLMKKEWFFFPLGLVFRSMGGIPINRSKRSSTVEQMRIFFSGEGQRHVAITPEGTRKANDRWKTGFLRIAQGAGVPVQLAVIDYRRKELGIFEIYQPTGDIEADLLYISSRYSAEQARKPEQFASNCTK
ncbi:acyltransferase, putative [Porphyromonas crevioricanis JCM 15906]|uniref:Acyltransferase, putative n=1 Tax=Porphyromonas crevioricanis JCM 15906 TaxID=1305617 RepID=T1CQC8_9PORP|nr:acyltransferase, putative [Porphyromonas crevioricanis JCM 15906]GAD06629.1 acyltransferase, putative [Porphyromonas crevioricanis JCM 13913]